MSGSDQRSLWNDLRVYNYSAELLGQLSFFKIASDCFEQAWNCCLLFFYDSRCMSSLRESSKMKRAAVQDVQWLTIWYLKELIPGCTVQHLPVMMHSQIHWNFVEKRRKYFHLDESYIIRHVCVILQFTGMRFDSTTSFENQTMVWMDRCRIVSSKPQKSPKTCSQRSFW